MINLRIVKLFSQAQRDSLLEVAAVASAPAAANAPNAPTAANKAIADLYQMIKHEYRLPMLDSTFYIVGLFVIDIDIKVVNDKDNFLKS